MLNIFFLNSRMDSYRCVGVGQILAIFKHSFNKLCAKRRPGAVFNYAYSSVFVASFCELVNEISHKGKNFTVVGGGCKYYFAVAESIFNSLCHIAAGEVVDCNLGAAVFFELFFKKLNCLFGVAVNGGIADYNTFAFNAVA